MEMLLSRKKNADIALTGIGSARFFFKTTDSSLIFKREVKNMNNKKLKNILYGVRWSSDTEVWKVLLPEKSTVKEILL